MSTKSYQEYKEVEKKIKAFLMKKADRLYEHWLETHGDIARDRFTDNLVFDPEGAVNRLISELDNAHRKLYCFLSGKEIVNLLRSKMPDEQIVNVLIDIGETHETKLPQYLIVSEFRNHDRDWDEEVFTDDDSDLAHLVSLLPDGSSMKKDTFTVNIDIGPFYFCVKADTFLKEVEHLINDALADGYIKELLETGSDAKR